MTDQPVLYNFYYLSSVGFSFGESINSGNLPKEDCFYPLENYFSIRWFKATERSASGAKLHRIAAN